MCSKASPVNLVCNIVLRKYVFSRLKADTFLSHSHVVTGKVENILRHSVMLGYIVWSISFKVVKTIFEVHLAVYFYYLYVFIMKILTDFRKTVETGMDPRLNFMVNLIVHVVI